MLNVQSECSQLITNTRPISISMYHGEIGYRVIYQETRLLPLYMIKHLATVITNLLSAIPWIGQDFVEFVKLLLFIITRAYAPILSYFITKQNYNNNMSTIGKVNESALRGQKSRTDQDKQAFLSSVSYDFLSMLRPRYAKNLRARVRAASP